MYLAEKGIDQTVDFSQSVYDWEGMKNGDAAAISKLMYDVGCSVNMQYTPYESGAQETNALKALVTHFGYDEASTNYSGWAGEDDLRKELRAGRPVFYVGGDTITKIVWIDSKHWYRKLLSQSHAMVCDGFSDDGLFHFNIGWGGHGDGYYTLEVIRPNGDDDLTHSYGPMRSMIYGIKPGEKICVDGIWYDIDEAAGTATVGSGAYEGDVTIPEQFAYEGNTYRVTAMYPNAFTERPEDKNVITNLTFNADIEEFPARFIRIGTLPGRVENVSFGGGVRRIADNAFYEMKDLKSVTLGDNVESIGKECFYNCTSLVDIKLGKSITEIPDYAFTFCKIYELDVPESVKRIGKHAISGSLFSVKFNGPIELDTCAVGSWDQIIDLQGLEYCTRIAYNGLIGATGVFTPNPKASYDSYAIKGKFDKIIIPADRTEYDHTTALETKEFYVEPGNPNYASAGGALYTKDMKTLLALPLVKHDGTYDNYSRFIPMGVTEITGQPLGLGYLFLHLPPSLQRIRSTSVGGYNLRRIYSMNPTPPVFDDDLQDEIQYNAELHVPAGSEDAYASAPVWNKIRTVVGDMHTDDKYVYSYDNKDNFVRVIGRNAEAFTGHDFMVPSTVTIDGEKLRVIDVEPSVFQGDHAVESVTLGSFVESVREQMFMNCSNLKRVKVEGEIYAIYDQAFENCTALESVEISRNNQLSNLGERMFAGCTSLKSVDLTSTQPYFMNFGKSAFEGCTSLRNVKGLSNVYSLPARTFANSGIETFHIGAEMSSFENMSYDEDSPFYGCQKLHTITVSPENDYFYAVDGILYYYREWDSYPWSILMCPPLELKDGKVSERSVVNISERCDILSRKFPATVKEVIIPATMKSIQYGIFNLASGMEKVTVLCEDPNFVSGGLFHDDIYDKATLQVPKGAKEAYAAHYEWKRFANIVEIDPEDYPSPEAIKAQQEAEQNKEDDPTVGSALEILMQDGTTHYVRLVKQPVLTITENRELNISGQNLCIILPITDIRHYRFDIYDLASVETVGDDSRVNLDFSDGDLKAKGLKSGQHVMLFDLQGRLLQQATAGSDGTVSLSLNDLPTAVYVLKVNETTYKILKK